MLSSCFSHTKKSTKRCGHLCDHVCPPSHTHPPSRARAHARSLSLAGSQVPWAQLFETSRCAPLTALPTSCWVVVWRQIDGIWNLSAEQGQLGKMFVTNVRFVWYAKANEMHNISVSYYQVVRHFTGARRVPLSRIDVLCCLLFALPCWRTSTRRRVAPTVLRHI